MSRTTDQRRAERLRQDSRDNPNAEPVAYEDQEGRDRVWQGDDLAPWVRIVNPSGDPIAVMGDIAHDQPDTLASLVMNNGGHATAAPQTPVNEADRSRNSLDLAGRQRVRVSGIDADGNSVDVVIDPAAALAAGGAVNHDDVYTGFPVPVGGIAEDEAPAAVADADMVRFFADLVGRQQINHPLSIAGENLVHDYLATTIKPLAVEQDSWLRVTSGAAVASLVLKASAGRCRMVMATNANAADRYLMLFNATSLPANGTIPIWVEHVQATGADKDDVRYIKLPEIADYFDTGIVAAMSSTLNSLTVGGADHIITALVK